MRAAPSTSVAVCSAIFLAAALVLCAVHVEPVQGRSPLFAPPAPRAGPSLGSIRDPRSDAPPPPPVDDVPPPARRS
ncbi:hypothetical protein ACP70R_030319 [Stipagrostis hirtigluma subsp. patula]